MWTSIARNKAETTFDAGRTSDRDMAIFLMDAGKDIF